MTYLAAAMEHYKIKGLTMNISDDAVVTMSGKEFKALLATEDKLKEMYEEAFLEAKLAKQQLNSIHIELRKARAYISTLESEDRKDRRLNSLLMDQFSNQPKHSAPSPTKPEPTRQLKARSIIHEYFA